MPFGLLKYGLSSEYPAKHHFTPTTKLNKHYDVVIIGAGAAGLMCAIEAGKRGRRVLVLDHAKKLAEKIRISGAVVAISPIFIPMPRLFCRKTGIFVNLR